MEKIDVMSNEHIDPLLSGEILGLDSLSIHRAVMRNLSHSLGKDMYTTTMRDWYKSTALSVREPLMSWWHLTQQRYYKEDVKRVYYFSMEFLMGRSLSNNMLNMGIEDACRRALYDLGQSLESIEDQEVDAGLGNGGLGRLASCFLDSMATKNIPGYGYGLRYEYGAFSQDIVKGQQVENADHWLQFGHVWEIERPESMYMVRFGGMVKDFIDDQGQWRHVWLHDQGVMAAKVKSSTEVNRSLNSPTPAERLILTSCLQTTNNRSRTCLATRRATISAPWRSVCVNEIIIVPSSIWPNTSVSRVFILKSRSTS